jgi:hypothetical protein
VSWATLLYRDALAHFEDQLTSLLHEPLASEAR